jgi:hypothetical protein
MQPEYKVVIREDGIQRVYFAHKYNDAGVLFHLITRELPYAELWEGNRLLMTYDALGQLMT